MEKKNWDEKWDLKISHIASSNQNHKFPKFEN